MSHINVEIKAHCRNPLSIERLLRERGARFVGTDHQIDTYFKVPKGRLKLREGSIEKTLIHYNRVDQYGPKQSDVTLFETPDDVEPLKKILTLANGVLAVVDKQRQIYFIENVKFHIDKVVGLGNFVEVEAIDTEGVFSAAELLAQCEFYVALFKIAERDLLKSSYSDMVLDRRFEFNLNDDFDFDL